MIERTLFDADHLAFKDAFERFVDKEIAPHHAEWEVQGYVDKSVWRQAGENGFLCMTMPEAYGGALDDKRYSVIQMEVLAAGGLLGHWLRFAQRDRCPLFAALRHRRAKGKIPAKARQR